MSNRKKVEVSISSSVGAARIMQTEKRPLTDRAPARAPGQLRIWRVQDFPLALDLFCLQNPLG